MNLFTGITPNWGPFAAKAPQFVQLIGVVMAFALALCIGAFMFGWALKAIGAHGGSLQRVGDGSALIRAGAVGVVGIAFGLAALTALYNAFA